MRPTPTFADRDLSSLRTGFMAGSICRVEVMRRCIDGMGMREVAIVYGVTETSPVSCQTRSDDDLDRRTASLGRVHPHLESRSSTRPPGTPSNEGSPTSSAPAATR